MDIKLEVAFFILAAVLFGILGVWGLATEKRLKKFFMGKKAKDLEETIAILEEKITKLENWRTEAEKDISEINTKLKKAVRGVETIRFNPFPDQGGNQSFAIGLLNEEGDGLVLSSLYSRERMSIFAKPVKQGRSEYELTKEEKEALTKAKV